MYSSLGKVLTFDGVLSILVRSDFISKPHFSCSSIEKPPGSNYHRMYDCEAVCETGRKLTVRQLS